MKDDKQLQPDTDWENRTLCSDESCIGVIGKDGRCKECGLPYEGEINMVSPAHGNFSEAPEEESVDDEMNEDIYSSEDPDWENRKLCRDENCIGVIGPDGKCKECGLTYDES